MPSRIIFSPYSFSQRSWKSAQQGCAREQSDERRVPLTIQVKRHVKAEIQAIARREGGGEKALSASAVGATLLERAVQQTADMRYGELLAPILKREIHQNIQAYSDRTAHLALAARAEATLARICNEVILSLILKDDPDLFEELKQAARDEAAALVSGNKQERAEIG
jgi:hypothetical protein